MTKQVDLFTGQELRDKGIERAIENADLNHDKWSDRAYQYLLDYIKSHDEFLAEDVRTSAEGLIEIPPSQRAWGGIIMKARKAGLIKRKGYRAVKNPKAHCTPATLWEVS